MPEKRLFYTKGKDAAGKQVDESFYEAHAVDDVRKDVQKRSGAVSVEHETLTSKPDEFYGRLKNAEATKNVVPERVKGLGQRWTVEGDKEEGESIPPFVSAAAIDGGESMTERTPYDLEIRVNKEYGAVELEFVPVEDPMKVLEEIEKAFPADMGIAPSPLEMYDPALIDPTALSQQPCENNVQPEPDDNIDRSGETYVNSSPFDNFYDGPAERLMRADDDRYVDIDDDYNDRFGAYE